MFNTIITADNLFCILIVINGLYLGFEMWVFVLNYLFLYWRKFLFLPILWADINKHKYW
jgi:hypothetical protein